MAPRCAGGPDSVRAFPSSCLGTRQGRPAIRGHPMPDKRLFQAAIGRRLRGQFSLAPPGAGLKPKPDTLCRVVGVGLVVTGVVLIASITLVAQDTRWLGLMTVGAASNNCDDNGSAKGCFFT